MKFSFRSFVIGFGCAALSLGAITYANAAGDATLKACANKTTGTMRYISKGSCKKTETSLSWSQMGPQGLPGTAGENGTAGTKGDAGTTGTNGQNFYVIDADGKTLGKFVTSSINNSYGIMVENRLWAADPGVFGFYGVPSSLSYYSDSSCKNPLFETSGTSEGLSQQWVGIEHNAGEFPQGRLQKAYVRLNNTKLPKSSFPSIYRGGFGSGCSLVSSDPRNDNYLPDTSSFYKTVEIPMLTYTAPLTIVAK